MGRYRIIGKDVCPRRNCTKKGRYSTKPMLSWNTNRKFDKKREYSYFIHNDGSRHNIEKYSFAKTIKGKYFESALLHYRELVKWDENHSRILKKYSQIISKYRLLEHERKRIDVRLDLWKKELNEFINNDMIDEIFQLGILDYGCKTVGTEIPIEVLNRIKTKIAEREKQIEEHFDKKEISLFYAQFPVYEIIYYLYNKYQLPERRTLKQKSNKRQSDWPYDAIHIRDGII